MSSKTFKSTASAVVHLLPDVDKRIKEMAYRGMNDDRKVKKKKEQGYFKSPKTLIKQGLYTVIP